MERGGRKDEKMGKRRIKRRGATETKVEKRGRGGGLLGVGVCPALAGLLIFSPRTFSRSGLLSVSI
jgi:hypothetical protein